MTTNLTARNAEQRRNRVDVSEITFGVEIECFVPHGSIQAGGYHSGRAIPGFPAGWNAQSDGSLSTRRRGYQAVEIVSGILSGADGVRQIVEVVGKLNDMNAKVNATCGLHIHVGFNRDRKQIVRLAHLVANFEKAIFASTGSTTREHATYTGTIRHIDTSVPNWNAPLETLAGRITNRYQSVNFQNLFGGRQQTVEFRAFQGTLNIQKIVGYVRMCVGLVERALTVSRRTTWTARTPVPTSPIARKGEGATCLTRLFYQLGWTKGRTSHTFGDLTGDDLPTIKDSKRMLMKMARKYDS